MIIFFLFCFFLLFPLLVLVGSFVGPHIIGGSAVRSLVDVEDGVDAALDEDGVIDDGMIDDIITFFLLPPYYIHIYSIYFYKN